MRRSLVVTDSRIWTAETEYALSVARAERSLGWDVTVAAPEGSAASLAAGADVATEPLPGDEPGRSPADLLANVRFLSGLLSDRCFDVVHPSGSVSHLAAALASGARAPVVHLRGGARPPARSRSNRFLYGRMTRSVIVSSERIRRWVVEGLSVPRERVHRILAPVDVGRFEGRGRVPGLRRALGASEDGPLIVNVARLAPVKGQHVLLEAMPAILRAHAGATLVLVGEAWSGEPEALIRRARELGVGRSVLAVGRRSDVPAILAEASLCVCSSVGSEENSRAVSEYMAAGRPVVATRVGVIPELVTDGVSGLLVDPRDAAGLASAVVSVLGDPRLAARLGDAARRFAREELSRETFGRRIGEALGDAGSGAAAPPKRRPGRAAASGGGR